MTTLLTFGLGIGTLGIGTPGRGTAGIGTGNSGIGSGGSGGNAGSGTDGSGGSGSGSGTGTVGSGGNSTLEPSCIFAGFGRLRASATLVSLIIMDDNVRSRSGKMNEKLLEPIVGASK
ncbi:hypothetical protein E2542_SST00232 [Spatholobus suberectus]|nr:hypothetical protein E2542_SST00232 [Spatholobus suberectus]